MKNCNGQLVSKAYRKIPLPRRYMYSSSSNSRSLTLHDDTEKRTWCNADGNMRTKNISWRAGGLFAPNPCVFFLQQSLSNHTQNRLPTTYIEPSRNSQHRPSRCSLALADEPCAPPSRAQVGQEVLSMARCRCSRSEDYGVASNCYQHLQMLSMTLLAMSSPHGHGTSATSPSSLT